MPPNDTIKQDIREIKNAITKIQEDVNDIKVELGKHHEKFISVHERVDMLNDRTEEAKKEVKTLRIWLFSSAIAALLSLIGAMFGIIRWLFEKST